MSVSPYIFIESLLTSIHNRIGTRSRSRTERRYETVSASSGTNRTTLAKGSFFTTEKAIGPIVSFILRWRGKRWGERRAPKGKSSRWGAATDHFHGLNRVFHGGRWDSSRRRSCSLPLPEFCSLFLFSFVWTFPYLFGGSSKVVHRPVMGVHGSFLMTNGEMENECTWVS